MIVNQDWRSLLEAQIAAHWEDVCRQAGACLSGSEVRLLEEYGSQALLGGLERSVKARRDMIARTERPTYEVIEESADRVIAEVNSRTRSPYGLCIPLQTMRVHLIAGESGWQIADIFEVCFKCNRSARRDGHSGISDVVERAARESASFVAEAALCRPRKSASTVAGPEHAQIVQRKRCPAGFACSVCLH